MQPKVSVIIPVYNVEKCLRQCLDSVVNQTLKDIEIICVDDGSTDNSLKILKEYAAKDDRFIILEQENQGAGAARNKGLEIAKSEYISLIDSDDWIKQEYCEVMYKNMIDNDVDLVLSYVNNYANYHSENIDQQINNMNNYIKCTKLGEGLYEYDFIKDKKIRSGPTAKLYKISIIKQFDIKFPTGVIQEDEAFYWLYMIHVNKIYSNTTLMYNRLIHEDSIMYQKNFHNVKILDQIKIYEHVYNYLKKYKLYKKYKYKFKQEFYNICQNVEKTDGLTKTDFKNYKKLKSKLEWKFGLINPIKLLFSVTNSSDKKHKVITILGIKIKISKKSIEHIFSAKNCDEHKVITILGFKIKLKKYDKQISQLKNQLQNQERQHRYELCKYMHPDMYPVYLKDWYKKTTGETLNLENPQTFNEKIQWLKLYDSTPLKTRLADKYLVRDWVKEKIGEEYLIPLLGVWDNFDEIDFDKLPNQFVLKCNHGCGYNIIVNDKSKFNKEDARRKIDNWMNEDFAFRCGLELHYSAIPRKIIAEKYIENSGNDLYDYKFWCFDGKVKYIQFLSERNTNGLKMAFYDKNWEKQDFVYSYPLDSKNIPRPENLEIMVYLAEKLAEGFNHVRVDFYRLEDSKVYFGEMTFTSCSGVCKWIPETMDMEFGQLIELPINKKEYVNC